MPRPDEATPADEMAMARAWLAHLRGSAFYKLDGLSDDQLRWAPTATANALGVIVVHLGYAERLWLRAIFAGEAMDMAWRGQMFDPLPAGWSVADVVAFYRAETATADAVLDAAPSFDERSRGRAPAHHAPLGRHAPDRGDRPPPRPHGHHEGARSTAAPGAAPPRRPR